MKPHLRNIMAAAALTAAISLAASEPCDTLSAPAPEPIRPVAAFYSLEAGSASLTDTYLTPLRYEGWHLCFDYDRWQPMKASPERWLMNLRFGLGVDRTENTAGNATMWNLGLDFSWGVFRRWHLVNIGGITAGIGPRLHLNLGCLYTARNGNNPASAKAAVTLDCSAYVARRFRVLGKDIDLRYVTTIPVTGAFFSPDYGELYYEIWLGNRSGLAHAAWWGNYFRWENDVLADLHLGGTVLTLGYRCNLLSTKVCDINTRIVSHSFVLGIGGEWISLAPSRRPSPEAEIISAFY